MQGNKRGKTAGSSRSKNSDIFSLQRQLVLRFGYCLMVSWLFCFLCFTSCVSLTSFYIGDMFDRAFMSFLFSGELFQLLLVSNTVKVPGHCASCQQMLPFLCIILRSLAASLQSCLVGNTGYGNLSAESKPNYVHLG